MQKVGHHLQVEAKKKLGEERDLFARSAYNRYYYAVFLLARSAFASINADWSVAPHKSYPEILKGTITGKFRKAKQNANKVHDYDLIARIENAVHAAAELAKLMEKAYATRIVADYQPLECVVFNGADRFSLKKIDITDAHSWHEKAMIWTKIITDTWAQIDVQ